jgi:glycosyltransferase involved in cell wall biosynthesis
MTRERNISIIMPVSFFPKSPTDSVPRFVEDQINAFLNESPSLQITVLVPHHGESPSEEVRNGFKVIRYHYFWPYRLERLAGGGIMPSIRKEPWLAIQIPFLFLAQCTVLLRMVRKAQYDYIYAHWFTPQGIVAAIVSALTRTPFCFTSHSSDVDIWKRIPLIGRLIVRRLLPKARAITVVSQRSYEKIQAFFTQNEWRRLAPKVAVIPMGIHTSEFTPEARSKDELKRKYNLGENFVLFSIGRMVEKKGLKYLLEAFAQLHKTYGTSQLVLAGDGPLKGPLEAQAEALGIGHAVRFVGFLSGKEKIDYLSLADILVIPSIITADGDAEGLPVSLMEGLASQTICIATRVSGADDILKDGESGLLIDDRNATAIVNAISRILTMTEPERASMREAASSIAETLDWTVLARRHLDHLMGPHNV